MTWDWLLHIFKFEGSVMDVYVSHKKRRKHFKPFGFVCFRNRREAEKAMGSSNGLMIRGNRIAVLIAKYGRRYWDKGLSMNQEKGIMETRTNSRMAVRHTRSYKEVLMSKYEDKEEVRGDTQVTLARNLNKTT